MERNNEDPSDENFQKAMDQIESMENGIGNASVEINRYRLRFVADTRDSLTSALHMSQGRRFRLTNGTYYFDGNYGVKEGYRCEYYKKPSGKELEANYKTFLWSTLDAAHLAGRDLMMEINERTIASPEGFSHDTLLASYFAGLVSVDVEKLAKKQKADEQKELQRAQKLKSNAILKARKKADGELTDPADIRAVAEEAFEMDALVKKLVGGERVPGDDNSDESDASSVDSFEAEDDHEFTAEGETEPQLPLTDVESEAKRGGNKHHKQSNDKRRNTHTSSHSNKSSKKLRTSSSRKDININSSSANSHRHHSNSRDKAGQIRITGGRSSTKKPKHCSNKSEDDKSSTDSEMELSLRHQRNILSSPRRGLGFVEDNRGSSSSNCKPPNHWPPPELQQQSSAATSPIRGQTLLQQLQQHEPPVRLPKPSRKSSSRSANNDDSTLADYDPTFPELDGHPQAHSMLHDIDEDLIRPEYNNSDSDAEMENEEHTSNVGASKHRSSSSPGNSPDGKKKRAKRTTDPEKVKRREATALTAETKRLAKLSDAKMRRDQAVFQRRVLEVNNGRPTIDEPCNDDPTIKPRKRRVTSGLSESWNGFYGRDMAINQQTQPFDLELIRGCADVVLGKSLHPHEDELQNNNDNDDAEYAAVLSYRQKSGAICDRVLKQKLMKHLQLDIFKEITFERLITEYSVAKRESVGVADDEIIDIDWFEVMGGFSDNLKKRLVTPQIKLLLKKFVVN
jgi:hypothetical protein